MILPIRSVMVRPHTWSGVSSSEFSYKGDMDTLATVHEERLRAENVQPREEKAQDGRKG